MALRLVLQIKPLSSNRAWQGRRFSTPEKKRWEQAVVWSLPKVEVSGPYYRVVYDFYLVNAAMSDVDNFIKTLQDCLVKRGIISDDRRIMEIVARKHKATKDRIEVEVEGIELGPGAA